MCDVWIVVVVLVAHVVAHVVVDEGARRRRGFVDSIELTLRRHGHAY